MPVTNYYSANGVMIAEHTTGQSRLDYVNDALGSVISTVDQTLTVKSTAKYKPYGAVLSETGTQPMYGWVGSPGYRRTGLPHSDIYVRKRHPSTVDGRWTTVDPLWPYQSAYLYVLASPTIMIDFWGLQGPAVVDPPVEAIPETPDQSPGNPGTGRPGTGVPGRGGSNDRSGPPPSYLINDDDGQIMYGLWSMCKSVYNGLTAVAQEAAPLVPSVPSIRRQTLVPKTKDCKELLKNVHQGLKLCDKKQNCAGVSQNRSLSPDQICDELRNRMYNARDCYLLRKRIRDNCPPPAKDPTNANHDDQQDGSLNAYKTCRAEFYKLRCERFYG